ncbi:PREDICTED: uroporphyrinogen-III synthase-like [Priapulus caudatus]|uniref:Uroporphyrinogen-III synthase-like n=1 Tax=Priapulus caudatus TaxID=37621 RepID=A0ABM1F6U0_PRICU|nr:PREDICTED: uroporphyrinogen-III synthase-like [Priapulus caudatus]
MPSALLLRQSRKNMDSDPYHQLFVQHGISASSIPVLQFDFVNVQQLAQLLETPGNWTGLVLTSQHSVEALAMAVEKCSDCNVIAHWKGKHVFVVGEATKKIAESRLGLACQGESCGNAKSLARFIINEMEELPATDEAKPLLFPCSSSRQESLPTMLTNAGVGLECIAAYETRQHVEVTSSLHTFHENHGVPDYIVFFSPSGVSYTLETLKRLNFIPYTKCVAIGASTAEALQSEGVVCSTAQSPTPEGALQACLQMT